MSTNQIICPRHKKPAWQVIENYYRCSKCSIGMFYVEPKEIQTEYARCREIEAPYRTLYNKNFYENREYHQNILVRISGELHYPTPRLCRLEDYNIRMYLDGTFVAIYEGNHHQTKSLSKIAMSPRATEITLLHEFSHHVAFVDQAKVCDEQSRGHGGDFLVIEKMVLELFHKMKSEGTL